MLKTDKQKIDSMSKKRNWELHLFVCYQGWLCSRIRYFCKQDQLQLQNAVANDVVEKDAGDDDGRIAKYFFLS